VRFEIGYSQYLRPDGALVGELPASAPDDAVLEAIYRAMVRTRTFDAKAIALQRTGRLGTYASSLGQEAVAVGTAAAMRERDVLVPSFREHGAQLWRGVTPTELLQYWGGDERGMDFAGPREDFPVSVPVGTHAPHAAGVALAMKLRGEPRVTVCMLGDGATSKGDFYEALNMAGVWRLPVVYVVSNNEWAISTPRSDQTAAETIAQKAIAAGIPGSQLDGNDVIAVYTEVRQAIERAEAGEGPALIEALTYRLADHTTSDDARRYRADAEVSTRWEGEPIGRLRTYLTNTTGWTHDDEQQLVAATRDEIEAASEDYLATDPQSPESMFDYLFATLPAPLESQRADMLRRAATRARDA
jgi:2-oxoisovalerate dehydrogenase E1 component subunit alpha